jgi:ribosomal protein S18 acetylase RimI-like enzyme
MTAASLFKPAHQNGLQPVDLGRHLGGIANLIELCFGAELDAGGRGLIREMQLLSRAGPAVRLLQALTFGQQPWNSGYVWVEDGQVVGTVSTQPAGGRSSSWLVANVAVHPDYRRKGIALALMRATLDLLRSRGVAEAILQVDDDNLGAVNLYRNLGFARVTTQTTWSRPGYNAPPAYIPSALEIRLRQPGEWAPELALARLVRPAGLLWARPLSVEDFRAGLRHQLGQFFSGQTEEHWVIGDPLHTGVGAEPLAGALILNMGGLDGDRLHLLVHPSYQGQLERPLLVRALRRLGRRPGPARLEYDADDEPATHVLTDLGFQPKRVLRWMRYAIH